MRQNETERDRIDTILDVCANFYKDLEEDTNWVVINHSI